MDNYESTPRFNMIGRRSVYDTPMVCLRSPEMLFLMSRDSVFDTPKVVFQITKVFSINRISARIEKNINKNKALIVRC